MGAHMSAQPAPVLGLGSVNDERPTNRRGGASCWRSFVVAVLDEGRS
jgi:hypothetical protein